MAKQYQVFYGFKPEGATDWEYKRIDVTTNKYGSLVAAVNKVKRIVESGRRDKKQPGIVKIFELDGQQKKLVFLADMKESVE